MDGFMLNRPYVLPTPLAEQLEAAVKPPQVQFAHWTQKLMGMWKVWRLMNPLSFFSYSTRNALGDLDAVVGASPGIVKDLIDPNTRQELWDFYTGGKIKLSPELRAAAWSWAVCR